MLNTVGITGNNIVVTNASGKSLSDSDFVGTGMTLKVGTNVEFKLVVQGDINGDGMLTALDLSKLQFHLIDKEIQDEKRINEHLKKQAELARLRRENRELRQQIQYDDND